MMRLVSLLLGVVVLLFSVQLFAHDLGFVRVHLSEVTFNSVSVDSKDKIVHAPIRPERYQLALFLSSNMAESLTQIGLPEHCKQKGSQRSADDIAIHFTFVCESKLAVADTLFVQGNYTGLLVTTSWNSSDQPPQLFLRDGLRVPITLSLLGAQEQSAFDAIGKYLFIGVEHILTGIDHLLFIAAIFLLVRSRQKLLVALTAFTVGHSVTLVLAYLDLLTLNSAPVEAAIALSLVIMAYEATRLYTSKPRPLSVNLTTRYPAIIAALFGLIHGLGFAGALSSLNVAKTDQLVALLGFNLGVELGQLLFLSLLVAVAYVRQLLPNSSTSLDREKYVLACLIGGVGLYWSVDRSLAVFV